MCPKSIVGVLIDSVGPGRSRAILLLRTTCMRYMSFFHFPSFWLLLIRLHVDEKTDERKKIALTHMPASLTLKS